LKVLIVHNNYQHIGGPESYMYNIKYLLTSKGHQCEIFTFKNEKDHNQTFYDLLPNSILDLKDWKSTYKNLNLSKLILLFLNAFFNFSVYNSLKKVIKLYKPDIIYLLQFNLKLSTSVIDAAKYYKIPIVCRVSDFNRICSKNILFRDGNICMKCIDDNFNMVKYNCNNNLKYTILDYLVRKFNEKRNIYNYIHSYIAPTFFTKEIFETKAQFKNKFNVIFTPINNNIESNSPSSNNNLFTFIYFGRIAYDKGVDMIIDGFNNIKKSNTNIQLKLIGETDDFIANYKFDNNRINFFEKMNHNELLSHVISSKFSVFNSRWFDNLPNSLIESCLLGVPIIIPIFGSYKDLIDLDIPCLKFNPFKQNDFENCLLSALKIDDSEYIQLSNLTKKWALEKFNSDIHYDLLIENFQKAINNK
jgi:glycosyltransferase involved in cell wall biosynthesis